MDTASSCVGSLETAFEGLVLFEILLELVERRSADRPQFPAGQRRFQNVRRIHCTRRFACADQRVDFVDEKQDFAVAGDDLLHDRFESFFELTLILRTGNQRPHVERINDFRFQVLGDVAVDDSVGDALGDGGLADTRFTDQYRVVLRAARQNLQHAADLLVAADNGVEFA